jgi:hypothetical protein
VKEISERESRRMGRVVAPYLNNLQAMSAATQLSLQRITLSSSLDTDLTAGDISVYEPGKDRTLGDGGVSSREDPERLVHSVNAADPESLWLPYPKWVRIETDAKVLDRSRATARPSWKPLGSVSRRSGTI